MARDRVTAAYAALALALSVLSGCSSSEKRAEMGCPKLMPAPGADRIALFGPGGHAAKDVLVGGKITDLTGKCRRDKVGIVLNAEIRFYAERADMGMKDATFPYFVALVDPDEHVVVEEGFKYPFPFLPGESYRLLPAEKITVHVPVKTLSQGNAYTVLVGFQLTPDQLAFNRSTRPQQPQ